MAERAYTAGMRSDEMILLLLLVGVGAAALFMASQQPVVAHAAAAGPAGPATTDNNAEEWEIRRDPRTQRIVGYTVHRDARVGRAA